MSERNLPSAVAELPAQDFGNSDVIVIKGWSTPDPPGTPMHLPSVITLEYCYYRDDAALRTVVNASMPLFEDVAADAIAYWATKGITDEQVSKLRSVEFQVADLGPALGTSFPESNTVLIDDDAIGYGWVSNQLITAASGDPTKVGRMDLLTVVAHEFGHIVGRENETSGIMCNYLRAASRIDLTRDTGASVFDHPLIQAWMAARATDESAEPVAPAEANPSEQFDPLFSAPGLSGEAWFEDDLINEEQNVVKVELSPEKSTEYSAFDSDWPNHPTGTESSVDSESSPLILDESVEVDADLTEI